MTFLGYEPDVESRTAAMLREEYGIFIDGRFVSGSQDRSVTVLEPSTSDPLARVSVASAEDVERAISSADQARRTSWGRLAGKERTKYLLRLSDLLQNRSRELSALQAMESGRPIKMSRGTDLPLAVASLFHHAGWADKLEWAGAGTDPRPVGVVAQFPSHEHPVPSLVRAVAPALAAGNSVVLFPGETVPLSALVFAEICHESGLPPGTVNVLPAPPELATEVAQHPGVDKITFTGDLRRCRMMAESVAGRRAVLDLEVTGGGTAVLFDDAPVDQAIEGIVRGVFLDRGPTTCPLSRLLVQETASRETIERLRERIGRLRIDDPLDMNTDVGPLRTRSLLDKYTELVRSGEAEGAVRWTASGALPGRGYWYSPTLFTEVAPVHRIARQAGSLPILSISTFRTPQEAVDEVNRSSHRGTAVIWTSKGSKALWMSNRIQADTIWVNSTNIIDPAMCPGTSVSTDLDVPASLRSILDYLRETGR